MLRAARCFHAMSAALRYIAATMLRRRASSALRLRALCYAMSDAVAATLRLDATFSVILRALILLPMPPLTADV